MNIKLYKEVSIKKNEEDGDNKRKIKRADG